MTAPRFLEPARHVCLGCGGSCQGVRVRLMPGEAERIAPLAAELGVSDWQEGGVLRQNEGRCAFLGDDARCRIHSRFGADQKPWICRQYPLVVVMTEDGPRAGIDPGCYTAIETWRGSELPIDQYAAGDARVDDPQWIQQEQAVLSLLAARDVKGCLAALCPGEIVDGLPAGLAARWAERLRDPLLLRIADQAGNGPSFRAGILPILASRAGDYPLSAETDAWAIEVARRLVYLRRVQGLPPRATVLLALLGALAAGWADPRPNRFGPALAAFCRALMVPQFWRILVPSPNALMWVATGQVPT